MTCASSNGYFEWFNQLPISFTEWKSVLTSLATPETSKLSSTSDFQRRSFSQLKKSDRTPLARNQVFGDSVLDSFLVSSSNVLQPSVGISRQDVPKIFGPSTKRYVSSFKTLVNSSNSKQTQRLNYINDSVVILKLSKQREQNALDNNTIAGSQLSSKHSTLSMATTATFMSIKSQQQQQQQQPSSPQRLSPILKIEGQKRRIAHHDPSIIVPTTVDIPIISNSTNQMATSTSTHPQTNSSVFTYRSAAAGGNTVRQRAIAETASNNLLITTERLKSNISSSVRSTRQPLQTTNTLPSAYIPSQRNINQNSKSRGQQEKSTNSRENYDYPDPFTNCPQDVLSKLSQLTKLQLETIDWEKRKRFTKKKPLTNGTTQGKDSP